MSVTLHTGRPGSGKTYGMTRNALKAYKKGNLLVSNYSLKIESDRVYYYRSVEELQRILPEIQKRAKQLGVSTYIFMDEAYVYLNSRKWKSMSEETLRLLAQHRKGGLHLEGTTPSPNRIDTVMREIIDYWYVYQNNWFWFTRYEFNIDDDKMKKFPLSQRWLWKSKKIYNAYDTLEMIQIT